MYQLILLLQIGLIICGESLKMSKLATFGSTFVGRHLFLHIQSACLNVSKFYRIKTVNYVLRYHCQPMICALQTNLFRMFKVQWIQYLILASLFTNSNNACAVHAVKKSVYKQLALALMVDLQQKLQIEDIVHIIHSIGTLLLQNLLCDTNQFMFNTLITSWPSQKYLLVARQSATVACNCHDICGYIKGTHHILTLLIMARWKVISNINPNC